MKKHLFCKSVTRKPLIIVFWSWMIQVEKNISTKYSTNIVTCYYGFKCRLRNGNIYIIYFYFHDPQLFAFDPFAQLLWDTKHALKIYLLFSEKTFPKMNVYCLIKPSENTFRAYI